MSTLQTGHVGLNVTDLDRSVAFYTRVFGFEVAGLADTHAFLGKDGRLAVTLWRQTETAARTDVAGLHHLSFQVDTIEEVREAEEVLRGLGARFAHDGVVPHGEGASSGGIFFTDPDGIRLEIYAPSGAETASAPFGTAPTCGFF
ncbi:VOC family protein [Actinocorallia aurantiaca]|jgi:lactoylglutathione lyase|uniref:VOC family protein n=1 Tax=Actinocorallia aurantiaca TaxID=46204 RepID=A0ABN3U1E8_9ACTN